MQLQLWETLSYQCSTEICLYVCMLMQICSRIYVPMFPGDERSMQFSSLLRTQPNHLILSILEPSSSANNNASNKKVENMRRREHLLLFIPFSGKWINEMCGGHVHRQSEDYSRYFPSFQYFFVIFLLFFPDPIIICRDKVRISSSFGCG